jgi:hypothetical protein
LPITGSVYYRIASVDKDGKTTYSNTAAVKLSSYNTRFTVYPNPVKQQLNLTLNTTATGGKYSVRINTVAGKQVYYNANTTTLGSKLTVDAGSLVSGVYVVEITDATGNKLMDKFIKE